MAEYELQITHILEDGSTNTKTIRGTRYHHVFTLMMEKASKPNIPSGIDFTTTYNVVYISNIFAPLGLIYTVKGCICIMTYVKDDSTNIKRISEELIQLGAVALIVYNKIPTLYSNYRDDSYHDDSLPVFDVDYIPDIPWITAKSIQCTISKSKWNEISLEKKESPTRDDFVRTLQSNTGMTIQSFLPFFEQFLTLYSCDDEEYTQYMDHFQQSLQTMTNKFLLFDYLCKATLRKGNYDKWMTVVNNHSQLKTIVSLDTPTSLNNMNECLKMISMNEKLFYCSRCHHKGYQTCGCTFNNQVHFQTFANCFAAACIQIIFDNPKVAQDIPFPTGTNSTPKFFTAFVTALQSNNVKRYTTISVAAAFYLRVLELTPLSKDSLIYQLAWDLLCKLLKTWNPKSIMDIHTNDRQLIDILFTPSIADDNETIIQFRKKALMVLDGWTSNFASDSVKLRELLHVTELLRAETFDAVGKFTTNRFTTVESIQLKISSIDVIALNERLQSIRSNLTFKNPVDSQVFTLSKIMSMYNIFHTANVTSFATGEMTGTTMRETKTISEINASFAEFECIYDTFHLCVYFYLHRSQLFKSVKPDYYAPTTMSTMIANVKSFQGRLSEAFGSGMHYYGVCSVLNDLQSSDAVEKELLVLSNCTQLQISTKDITYFRMVHLLKDLSVPLQTFFDLCSLCGFKIIECAEFSALKSVTEKFYGASIKNLELCIAFFDEVYNILCKGLQTSQLDLQHKILEVTRVLHWLLPLSYASCGLNLWKFILNMEWSGKNGLHNFRKKVRNIRNHLKLHGAPYEVQLLDSIEVVVPLFLSIGKYKDCTGMSEFLEIRRDIKKLSSLSKDESVKYRISELNGRLLAAEDLFNSDLDQLDGISVQEIDTTDQQNSSCPVSVLDTKYDSSKQQLSLRRWLDYHCLPQIVADLFAERGIRCVDDVFLYFSKENRNEPLIDELLSHLPMLDQIKLRDAVCGNIIEAGLWSRLTMTSWVSGILSSVRSWFGIQEIQNVNLSGDKIAKTGAVPRSKRTRGSDTSEAVQKELIDRSKKVCLRSHP